MLAVVSVLLQIYKISYPFGIIDIDIVGVPWIISAFLFGLSGGIITSVVAAIGIAVFAPTGPVGALMKFLATIIMVLAVGFIAKRAKFSKKGIVLAFVACVVLRPIIMTFFNYFIGAPLFYNMSTEIALQQFPPEIFIIPNVLLAIIDFWLAYVLVFSTKLRARLDDLS